MKYLRKGSLSLVLSLIALLLSVNTFAQGGAPDWAEKTGAVGIGGNSSLGGTNGLEFRSYVSPLFGTHLVFFLDVESFEDPANHRCCTELPPESATVILDNDGISISTEDSDHWLNFYGLFNSDDPTTFNATTSRTVAGFDDVSISFTGEVFKNAIQINVVLGTDGELFGETLEYILVLDPGTLFYDLINAVEIAQEPIEKVRSVGGSVSNASFESGASSDGGATTGTDFKSNENVTIVGTISIDPDDQGLPGEIFVALLSSNNDGVTFSYLNEDGNYVAWDQTIPGLGAHITTDSLNETYYVTISSGSLAAGTYRVALAYSQGSKLVYAPKAIVVRSTD